MLKIKDNVDLKELEKFKFIEKTLYWYNEIRINKKTRLIEVGNYKFSVYKNMGRSSYYIPNILLDLIQAGLIEKVVQ